MSALSKAPVVLPSVSIGMPSGLRLCQFVFEKIHLVARVFVVYTGFQRAPLVLAGVAQIDLLAVVAGHVHALVGEALVRDVLQPQLQFQQMVFMAHGDADRLVFRFVAGGADFVAARKHG